MVSIPMVEYTLRKFKVFWIFRLSFHSMFKLKDPCLIEVMLLRMLSVFRVVIL